ncbi:GNAT family N-acetyltransferase [Histidinibacterium lentulum]|uniref:GNAT family N-acetyltransferase n=1 Tax=Histidinibacterium lentulum TaxID=2480588 RepID=A0A3N2R1Q8_9RHOB|nr:GNAT family N-acetyltransferase [Histidinibacterium lentulum]ROU01278.1 GNAT family N-acetyltransferase [Histidinibacterium lentulum]
MKIERIEEARLTPTDEAEIAALLRRCFVTDFGDRSYFVQRHHVRIVARDAGAIVGQMGLGLRAIRMGERLVDIVGLGDVCTAPERRGEGIASRLMEAAIAEARAMPAEFFVLFGDRPLYAGAGFEAHRNVLRFVDMEGARTNGLEHRRQGGLMVLPLGDAVWDGAAEVDLLGWLF